MNHNTSLLLFALAAVVALVILIARFKFHPFVALMLVAILIGWHSGMKLPAIAKAFQDGMGHTLGFLGVVVGLGMMLGKMLTESGGARVVAQTLVRIVGNNRLPWAMLITALLVGVPVLFSVGLLLLLPVIVSIARETQKPFLALGIPLVAGLSVSQGLLPPHPGPMLAIEQLGADVGKTMMYGALIGLPTAIVAGPIFATLVTQRLQAGPNEIVQKAAPTESNKSQPGFAITLLTILLPVLLILLATLADLSLPKGNRWREYADFVGGPLIAMLVALLFSLYSFGYARGFTGRQILKFLEECLNPAAGILLVVGAGGGLSKILESGGVGDVIASGVAHARLSPLILAWLVAASIRVAVGSATVAITMASAIMAPVASNVPGINRELLVLAMGAGSSFLSHVNDGGFWLVKESFHLTVPQTLKTWTVLETGVGLVGLLLVLLLDAFIGHH